MTWGVYCKACLKTLEHGEVARVVKVNGDLALMHKDCADQGTKATHAALREALWYADDYTQGGV